MGALSDVEDAVLVVDAAGQSVLRNAAAAPYDRGRHGDAVAEVVVTRLLDEARAGEESEEELSLAGPPQRVLSIRAIPLRDLGAIVGTVAFIRDVTDVRRVESIRRDFVANVSHELKTPIGALGLLAETIAEGGDLESTRQLSNRLVREADRLARIVDDLLDLSLIETQDRPIREEVALRQLLDDSVDRVHSAASARGISVRVDKCDDGRVRCDPTQVISALANLLDNAVKYSDEGEGVEISGRINGAKVVIEVRDHGIGIPSRDLERVFERFYRVDRARSRETGGTGLGLSIVRHVAAAHDGVISVESVEGEGSTFRLVLPTDPPTDAAAPTEELD